ncbi:hypothetical protein ACELLULO517_07565 [Acidisoma cellulosilytica]|uniref:Uncharacterized protein n=1 Tax=Acidisoma cellulosilyticum TaxID=2802395 RepID=A0A963Z1H3_9PROT|nr:hypothetical protein [Acidisoma cellulosilyticum]MCB8880088.1 hypothetical protein [Acidisoma cellulosilyticum]
MSNALAKIDGFLRLEKGWHYGSGVPVSRALVGRAKLLINLFHALGFPNVDAFPGVDGELMISAFEEGHCIEVTLELDGTFRLLHEDKGQEVFYEEGLSTYDLAKHFSFETTKAKRTEWYSSDLSTPVTTTSRLGSSRTWRLDQQRETQQFLALSRNAPVNEVAEYASMHVNTTNLSHTILQSSGFSTNPTFHKIAA